VAHSAMQHKPTTRVELQVRVNTELGDTVVITGSIQVFSPPSRRHQLDCICDGADAMPDLQCT
jgi:hypothetical protein